MAASAKAPDASRDPKTGNPDRRPSSSRLRKRSENCGKRLASSPREAARQFTDDALKTLAAICNEGQSEAARVSAACALLDRGYGKPTQQVETGSPGEFSRMTDEELDAQIAEGIEHVATHQANGRFTRN